MLVELSITNIALIDRLRVCFAQGLTVLTGETGAGKSIVVGSLEFLLGGRADKERIAGGASRGQVEALFDVAQQPAVLDLLAQMQLEVEDGFLPIQREINQNGRSLCRVAGVVVPLAQLRRLTSLLVDLHGQHAHQSLLDPGTHLSFLDVMGDDAHCKLVQGVRAGHEKWSTVRRELTRCQGSVQERARTEDMLRFQLEELDGALLVPEEEDQLEEQRNLMRNAERIRTELAQAYAYISEGIGEEAPSAMDALRTAIRALSAIGRYGQRYEQIGEQIAEIVYSLESVSGDLYDLREEAESDPTRLDEIEARLDLLNRLRRKYGATTGDMIAYREKIRAELEGSECADVKFAQLQKQEEHLRTELEKEAHKLSAARHALSEDCRARVQQELSDLGMERARFDVMFAENVPLGPDGLDKIEFLLSANAGEPMRPLSRVASGGELSRIMLAFKCIEAENEGVPVLVFDEIDTGISGRMGQVVADKMHQVARARQVLCVTHLPQIAASANAQYLVEKQEVDDRTRTTLTLLTQEGRIEAIARMLGDGDTAKAHARAMLDRAAEG